MDREVQKVVQEYEEKQKRKKGRQKSKDDKDKKEDKKDDEDDKKDKKERDDKVCLQIWPPNLPDSPRSTLSRLRQDQMLKMDLEYLPCIGM